MRVLWVSECPWVASGFGKVTYYMTKELRNNGIDVVVSCFSTLSIMNYENMLVFPYGPPLNTFIRMLENRVGDVDVVVFHGSPWIPPLSTILPQVTSINKKVIGYFVHEAEAVPKSLSKYFKYCNLLATPTSYTAKVLGISRYVVVPHGVNPEIWKPELKTASNDDKVVGMIAKNHPRKRWDMFFEAIAELIKKGYRVKALPYVFSSIHWEIPLILETIQQIHNVDIELIKPSEYDIFFGLPEDEQAKTLANMDIHALVSMGEAWGLPILETLAMGIPNVVVDYGAVREWCGDMCNYVESPYTQYSSDGMLHRVPSIENLVEKLIEVIEFYDEERERTLLFRNYIANTLSWENVAKHMVKALDEVLKYDDLIINEEQDKEQISKLKPKVIE